MGETRVDRAQEQTEGLPCLLKVMFGDLEIRHTSPRLICWNIWSPAGGDDLGGLGTTGVASQLQEVNHCVGEGLILLPSSASQ